MGSKKITLSCYYIHGILSTLLLFASLGSTFQQQKVANSWLYQSKRRYHRWYPLQYSTTDPSIIEYNRQYLSNRMGYSEEQLDKLEYRPYPGSILTLEIGILDDRAKWLMNRLSLNDNEIKKIVKHHPQILGKRPNSEDGLESKIDYLQNKLLLDNKQLKKLVKAAQLFSN